MPGLLHGMNARLRGLCIATLLIAIGSGTEVTAEDTPGEWPQFLGPQRNGISPETGLVERWPESGPKMLWRVPGGVGMSGLSISRGRAFTLVQKEGEQWLLALNADTGETLWRTKIAPEYRNSMGDGPRGTPAVSGDRVFAFTGEGVLAACDFQTGRVLWSHHVVKELKGSEADYGMASSPLVVGELVVITAGAPQATLAAYDVSSGALKWTAGRDPAGYSSPALLTLNDQPQIVAFSGASALSVAPASGKPLWRYPFETNYLCNIAMPLAINDRVFLSAGENHGSVLLNVKSANGSFETSPVWESLGPRSVLRSEWQTAVLLDGYLYGMDNVGGAGPVTHLTCIKADTGERQWQQARFGKGNLIAADGKLFLTTMKGELVIAKANPERFEELSRATVCGMTRQAPALSNGRLYLRDDEDILCIDVRKQ